MSQHFVGTVKLSLVSLYSEEGENRFAIVKGPNICGLLLLIEIKMTFGDNALNGSIHVVDVADEFNLVLGEGKAIGTEKLFNSQHKDGTNFRAKPTFSLREKDSGSGSR